MSASILTPEQLQFLMKLENIFMPNQRARRDGLYKAGEQESAKFVHYTSAEAAMNIIRTKRIWMRNTTCMSDYREVQHGFDLLNGFFQNGEHKGNFEKALDECSPNIAQEAINLFNQWWENIQLNTYITSISEHDEAEGEHGRLSMWRAFGGGSSRVALVFNIPWFTGASMAMQISLSPVAYLKKEEVYDELHEVISRVKQNRGFLRGIDREVLLNTIFSMLVNAVTCLKHEGFKEEREWRVIYDSKRSNSQYLEHAIEVVSGIPQHIYKIPLDKTVSDEIAGLDFARIFDRLIIGPSSYPWAQYEAFVDVLKKSGVSDAESRVLASEIPIRT